MKKFFGFLFSLIGIFFFFRLISSKEEIEVIPKKMAKKKVESSVKILGLTPRQEEILKIFKKRDVVLPSDIYAVAPDLSTRTLRRDMDKLVSLGVVRQEGSTKDTRYFFNK